MKNNWLKYIVVVALLTNVATLIFFWLNRPPDGGRPALRPVKGLIEALKLDDKQQGIFKTLQVQHHHQHDSLLQNIAAQRQALYSQKQTANDTIIQKIGLLQQEIERITYDHFKDIRKICTPEQQTQLDNLLEKTVQNILMPKNKRRPPPDR